MARTSITSNGGTGSLITFGVVVVWRTTPVINLFKRIISARQQWHG
jgi:hypothetical protein